MSRCWPMFSQSELVHTGMAAGSLIYVGKSRLRRKFRQQKIDNRLKRQERRRSERLSRESGRDGDRDKLSESSDSGHSSNGGHVAGEDNHCCRFCEDCSSVDFDSGSSGSDSDELLPLIDNLSLRQVYKMPLGFWKKKEPKTPSSPRPKISAPVQETPAVPPPYVAQKPMEPPAVQPPSAEDVSANITLLLEVERRLKEKEDQLKELEEKYLQQKQKLAEETARAAAEEAETVFEGELEPEDKDKDEQLEEEELAPECSGASLLKKKRIPEYQPGGMLCCTIM